MNKKIKIMMLISHMGDGGAQKVALNYLENLKDDPNIEIALFVYNKERRNSIYYNVINEKKLNVHYLDVKPVKFNIPFVKRFFIRRNAEKAWYEAIKKYNPDIIHIHIAELLYNTLNPILKLNKRIVFVHLHGHPKKTKNPELRIVKKAFQKFDFIPLSVTNEIGEASKKYYGVKKYELIYNGINIDSIKKNIISKEEARKRIGIEKDCYVFLGVGRLTKVKRFDLLIKIFYEYHKINQNSILLIAGDGPDNKILNDLIDKLDLKNSVRFVGHQENIISFYCLADVLLITSLVETSSLVLLEAQLCGLKCIISKGVPNESIISDKVIKIEDDLNIEKWLNAIEKDSNYISKTSNMDDYDICNNIKKLKSIYLKYWNDYNKK